MRDRNRAQIEKAGKNGANRSRTLPWVLDSFYLAAHESDESITPWLAKDGMWEAWISSWFTKNVRPGDLVVDVGANCGYYSMLSERLGADVVACEPNPVYVELLSQTKHVNNARFEIVPYAILDKEGGKSLSVPGNLHGSASVVKNFDEDSDEIETVRVKGLPLDNVVTRAPNFVKIDAELAEELVWKGMQEVIDENTVVVLEYSPESGKRFLNTLYKYDVTLLNFAGDEEPISKEKVLEHKDWITLVVRNITKG